MQVSATITLDGGSAPPWTSEEAAQLILDALGGDVTADSVSVQLSVPAATVGVPPQPPVPPS